MTFLGELRVDASHDNLRIISHFIHGVANRLSLSDKALFDLELAVEEAATNIINHAYGDRYRGEILLTVEQQGDFVQVALTDWGIPFNPDNVRPFDINAPIETRIKGGMGLYFINSLMDRVERQIAPQIGQPNVIRLTKLIERARPGVHPLNAVQELNVMRTISEVMTTNIDLDDLLNLIISKLLVTINAERGTLFLVDEENQEVWSRVLLDELGPLSEIRLKIGSGIVGHVAATGELLNIPNAYADSRFNPEIDRVTGFRTRSILTVPMFNPQQKVIGVVQLLNKKDGAFTMRDERLLTAMASQAAISIENARLYQQEMQQRLINRELETAHAIQASFLPDKTPQIDGWDLAAVWYPVRNVAGDFYDFYRLDDGRLATLIADVSGKGIPAALFMALTVTVFRFGMSLTLPPGELMRRANELIIADQRSRMFATVFTAYLSLDTGRVTFSSAGHNPPILYRAAEGCTEDLSASGVAVGIFRDAKYAEKTTHLDPGDILVLYTDGITETLNEDEDEFGEERLAALISDHATLSAAALADQVLNAVTEFSGEQAMFDDATLVIIKSTRNGLAR